MKPSHSLPLLLSFRTGRKQHPDVCDGGPSRLSAAAVLTKPGDPGVFCPALPPHFLHWFGGHILQSISNHSCWLLNSHCPSTKAVTRKGEQWSPLWKNRVAHPSGGFGRGCAGPSTTASPTFSISRV